MADLTPDFTAFAEQVRDEFRELYSNDPDFRARFNRYLLDEFGIQVVSDEPQRTLAQLGECPTRH